MLKNTIRRLFSTTENATIRIKSGVYNKTWLRDHCQCPSCVSPVHKQKFFASAEAPGNAEISYLKSSTDSLNSQELIHIDWSDGHKSTFTMKWLIENTSPKIDLSEPVRGWNLNLLQRDGLPLIGYSSYISTRAGLKEALSLLHKQGIVILKNVPTIPTEIENVAQKIGSIRNTFYGMTWDVAHSETSKNIAYTNVQLGLHMDLL